MAEAAADALSSGEAMALDMNAAFLGVSTLQLMENAGRAVAWEIASRLPPGSKIVIFGGTGRNGGDGMVAARHLASGGFRVSFVLIGRESEIRDECALRNFRILKGLWRSVAMEEAGDSSAIAPVEADAIIDALLGTGAKGPLRQPILQAVRAINASKGLKLSIDIPTGIDSDTGEVLGEAVRSDITVTFHKAKAGLAKAGEYAGQVKVVGIGIPPEAESMAGPGDLALVVRKRPMESHKGDFGRLLVIGGSETYTGAPCLVALAALRCGADLVYIAAPKEAARSISSTSPNMITVKLDGDCLSKRSIGPIRPLLERATAVAMGPGLGTREETFEAVDEILSMLEVLGKPSVIDADAVKAMGRSRKPLRSPAVLTPHRGEFKALTGLELPYDRRSLEEQIRSVKEAAKGLNCTILLKGPIDIVSDGERVKLNSTGNPFMTVGGTGDVLTGIVGCFLAQGAGPMRAATAGAFLNGFLGDSLLKKGRAPLLPTDMIEEIPKALNELVPRAFDGAARIGGR
ncbi:MAG: NAD(P)H-hydrate dehydratase [Candidatus Bathyarchaeia archaeon]